MGHDKDTQPGLYLILHNTQADVTKPNGLKQRIPTEILVLQAVGIKFCLQKNILNQTQETGISDLARQPYF